MKSSKSTVEALFGPLQKKTFGAALSYFFEEQCPQMGGQLTRQVLVNNIQKLVEEFYPPNTHLRMGQIMWPAVDENEKAAYGKTIEKTKLKPVFIDMIAPEDIEAMLKKEKQRAIRQRASVRLFQQAKQQGGVLTGVDVATMMRLSTATISGYVREWEKRTNSIVPRRGTVHDMGRSVTHKRQICYKMIVEGKSVAETVRETNHSPEAITRYIKDYKRILACLHRGLTPKETAFVVKVSEKLVYEYLNLIQENQIDIKEQMGNDDVVNFDNIPF
jgi:DNA-binding CsgD family transcriptional regulator